MNAKPNSIRATSLRRRVEALEAVGVATSACIVHVQYEPEPIDAPPDALVILSEFVETRHVETLPWLDLDLPLHPDVEVALANDAEMCSYHQWDAEARTFTSPHGLVRQALPKASDALVSAQVR